MLRISLLWALTLLAACGAADKHLGYSLTDSSGVRIATNDTPSDRLPLIISNGSDSAVTIGVIAGEAPYMFNHISDVARLQSGHIVVADDTEQLRVFDSTGRHVVSHGGKGQGPGEFLSISDIVAQQGDTMLVWDQHAMRYSVFSVAGGFVERTATRRKNLSDLLIKDFYYEHMYPVANGSLIVEVVPRTEAGQREAQHPVGQFIRPMSTLLWVNSDFTSYRKLGEHGGIEQIKLIVAGNPTYFSVPGGRWPHKSIAGSPPRVCVDGLHGPQVDCYHADGSATYVRWYAVPVPFPPDALDKWREREASRPDRASAEQVRAAFSDVPPLKDRPAVNTLNVDAVGLLWVHSPDLAIDSAGRSRYRIFDRQGQLIGYASVRGAFREIGRDYTLSVFLNADGVETVVMHRLNRDLKR